MNTSTFKIVVTAVFGVAFVAGIIVFATYKGKFSSNQSVDLVVWGTIPAQTFDVAYKNSSIKSNKQIRVNYIQKDSSSFDAEFVEALAEGRGPDIVVLRDDRVYKNRNRLFLLPYKNYTERAFKDRFIQAGETLLYPEGIIALPFIIDPMVMYWNRDIFSNNFISEPPKYWDQISPLVEKITRRDANANILQSTIALGEWSNITNAKDILSMLLLQAGTTITGRDVNSNKVISVLNSKFNYPIVPSQSAVGFYTQFSNPTSPSYSWNRSLPKSLSMFLSGTLATYIGFASEIFSIQQKNSNLNFDVTYVPQIRESDKKIVFGRMYVLAISKQSQHIAESFITLSSLTDVNPIKELETVTNLPPVRRDLLNTLPAEAFRSVFYSSALISRSWIDPDSIESEKIFRDMIETITSGRGRLTEVLDKAHTSFRELLD